MGGALVGGIYPSAAVVDALQDPNAVKETAVVPSIIEPKKSLLVNTPAITFLEAPSVFSRQGKRFFLNIALSPLVFIILCPA
jgi:hypothetical protein